MTLDEAFINSLPSDSIALAKRNNKLQVAKLSHSTGHQQQLSPVMSPVVLVAPRIHSTHLNEDASSGEEDEEDNSTITKQVVSDNSTMENIKIKLETPMETTNEFTSTSPEPQVEPTTTTTSTNPQRPLDHQLPPSPADSGIEDEHDLNQQRSSHAQPPCCVTEAQLNRLRTLINIIRSGDYQEFLQVLEDRDLEKNLLNVFVDGQTALHYSLLYGRSLLWCKQLILNGANPNLSNLAGWHPIHLAAFNCSRETLRYLIDCIPSS